VRRLLRLFKLQTAYMKSVIIILKEQLFYIVVNIFIIRLVNLSYTKHLHVI